MERWEPPIGPDPTTRRETPAERRRTRRDDTWPEAVELAAGRIGIGFFFVIAGTGRGPTLWLAVGGPLLVLVLFVLGALSTRWGQPTSRPFWLIDAVTLGLLTPLIVVSTFAAVGDGPLRDAERSMYVQSIVAAIGVLVGMAVLCVARLDRTLVAVSLLPAALLVPTISLAHDDFRVANVTSVLSYVWLTAALATIAVRLTNPTIARLIPIGGFTLYVLLLLAFDPSLATLGGRPAPVRAIQPLMILLPGAALVAPEILNRATSPRPASKSAGRPRRRPRRTRRSSERRGPE